LNAFSNAIVSRLEKGTQFLGDVLAAVVSFVIVLVAVVFAVEFEDIILLAEEVKGEC
jgi:hypothetical protein